MFFGCQFSATLSKLKGMHPSSGKNGYMLRIMVGFTTGFMV